MESFAGNLWQPSVTLRHFTGTLESDYIYLPRFVNSQTSPWGLSISVSDFESVYFGK